jgi:invasion protein IalB
LIEPDGDKKKIRVTIEEPMKLSPGGRIIIDKGQPIPVPYLACLSNRCLAEVEADPDMISKMKQGEALDIQAVTVTNQVVSFPLPLQEFKRANEGPTSDPNSVDEEWRKIFVNFGEGKEWNSGLYRGAPGAQLLYSPWLKQCSKGSETNAKQDCITGRSAFSEAGLPMLSVALIEPNGDNNDFIGAKVLLRLVDQSQLAARYGVTQILVEQDFRHTRKTNKKAPNGRRR